MIPFDAACFFKDGDAWCCVRGDFIDLQQSPAGFGETMDAALNSLHSQVNTETTERNSLAALASQQESRNG